MKLNKKQLDHISKYLRSKHLQKCGSCGKKKWEIAPKIFGIPELNSKESILPVISVMCKNCSNTLLFNAMAIGLIKEGK